MYGLHLASINLVLRVLNVHSQTTTAMNHFWLCFSFLLHTFTPALEPTSLSAPTVAFSEFLSSALADLFHSAARRHTNALPNVPQVLQPTRSRYARRALPSSICGPIRTAHTYDINSGSWCITTRREVSFDFSYNLSRTAGIGAAYHQQDAADDEEEDNAELVPTLTRRSLTDNRAPHDFIRRTVLRFVPHRMQKASPNAAADLGRQLPSLVCIQRSREASEHHN
ncbi:hypothetical protein MVEN_00662200 [Mycena venus]|uniref:Secreted protein n=1 Tax=Mycena venus TaxID=2733690 RepID=A0A8H6YN94_9AGAR|nr:hypothetical protein MVEN_00662200 [Mycena venus]